LKSMALGKTNTRREQTMGKLRRNPTHEKKKGDRKQRKQGDDPTIPVENKKKITRLPQGKMGVRKRDAHRSQRSGIGDGQSKGSVAVSGGSAKWLY